MMEFTYDGIVRQGFGFYNPNHAAAFFTLIMPFAWAIFFYSKSRWMKACGALITLLLTVALAMTFSRTGALVLVGEAAMFYLLTARGQWRRGLIYIGGLLSVFVLIGIACGVMSRFTIDKAATNRLDIWRGGLELFSANPLGVGYENSGILVSHFVLPEGSGIVCRTLVNSFLTFLVEFGAVAGIVLFTLIFYSFLRGATNIRESKNIWTSAALCGFCGTVISAFSASVFDFGVLFDFHSFGELSGLNFILSWLMLTGFIAAGIFAGWGKIRLKTAAVSALISAFAVTLLLCAGFVLKDKTVPEIIAADGETFASVKLKTEPVMILYDDKWDVKSVRHFMKKNLSEHSYILPLRSWQHKEKTPPINARAAMLFGRCASFSEMLCDKDITLISQPEYFEIKPNVRNIYLKRYAESPSLLPASIALKYY